MIDVSINARAARTLLERIFERAQERGIDQARLAAAAGIRPESLSRLKKAGACRLVTALELARAVGLTSLVLEERRTPRVAASVAARKLSAGRRKAITAGELVESLTDGKVVRDRRGHLTGFFEELPIESVHDVVLEEGLDYVRLVELSRALGAEGDTVDWLAEMAGDRVA